MTELTARTITAAEWGTVADDVAAGRVVVRDKDGCHVVEVSRVLRINGNVTPFYRYFWHEENDPTVYTHGCFADTRFTVTPVTPAAAPVATEGEVWITAQQFFDDKFADKIVKGECEVSTYYGQKIRNLTKRDDEDHYMIWPLDDKQIAGLLKPSSSLKVTWLTPTPAAAGDRPKLGDTLTPKAMTNRIQTQSRTIADLEAENARLRADLAAAGLRLTALTQRGSIIDWAIEAVTVWNHFVSTTDSDAPPSEALAITLNVLDSKVTEYQRTQAPAANAGTGGGLSTAKEG